MSAALAIAGISCLLIGLLIVGKNLIFHIDMSSLYERKLEKALMELNKLATEDALTGLKNHRHMDAVLAQEVARARRTGSPLGLIMFILIILKPTTIYTGIWKETNV
jgi:diguanylate cyclase